VDKENCHSLLSGTVPTLYTNMAATVKREGEEPLECSLKDSHEEKLLQVNIRIILRRSK